MRLHATLYSTHTVSHYIATFHNTTTATTGILVLLLLLLLFSADGVEGEASERWSKRSIPRMCVRIAALYENITKRGVSPNYDDEGYIIAKPELLHTTQSAYIRSFRLVFIFHTGETPRRREIRNWIKEGGRVSAR